MKLTYAILTAAVLSAGAIGINTPVHAQAVVKAASSSTALTSDEQQHFMETMQNGMIALETSRIARVKASHRMVKSFADSEVMEQETIASVLTSMAPTIKPPAMTKEGKAIVDKMNATPAGAEFDRMYVDGQLMGHRELLKAQDSYLDGGDVLAEINVAKLARGQIMDHIKALEALKVELAKTK